MSGLKLHIVCFDIPDPPDYGGAIDVFYKVKNLAEQGVRIWLHCPEYGGRRHSEGLENMCEKVFYYPRKTGLAGISLKWPYMVFSRRHHDLLQNLIQTDAPILFDGLSTSFYLNHPALKHRLKILRPQNIEQDYYRLLSLREKNLFRRFYYLMEANLIQDYEDQLFSAQAFFTVAQHDHAFFKSKYPSAVHEYIPSFQPYNEVRSAVGTGSFCLYHGNLALAENREAALYLIRNVIPKSPLPFIIAGRRPDQTLIQEGKKLPNCRIIASPPATEMERLIHEAHVHVLPTFQATGLKLKLLHALFNGRHVIVTNEMVHGTGLEQACHVCGNDDELLASLHSLKDKPFDSQSCRQREEVLMEHYNNRKNAGRIITFLQQRSP